MLHYWRSVLIIASVALVSALLSGVGLAYGERPTMPSGLRWFAEYQPFTPVFDTVRGLLLNTPIGNGPVLAVTWCLGLALVGYF